MGKRVSSKNNALNLRSVYQGRIYSIDLTAMDNQPINIGNQWVISFPPPTKIFGFNISRQSYKCVTLRLKELKVPTCWMVNRNQLLKVNYEAQSVFLNEPFEIALTEPETYFQLLLNTSAIKDCSEIQLPTPKAYNITFVLGLYDDEGEEILTVADGLQVRFVEVHSKPIVEFNESETRIKFTSQLGIKQITKLCIYNPANLRYFPALDGQICFHVKDGNMVLPENAIWIDETTPITDHGVTRTDIHNNFKFNHLDITKDGQSDIIELPVMANFNLLGNPTDAKVYDLIAEVTYNHENSPLSRQQLLPVTGKLVVLPNRQVQELRVWLSDWNDKKDPALVKNGDVVHVTPVAFNPEDVYNIMNRIIFENSAQEGAEQTGIIVRGIKQDVILSPKIAQIVYSSGRDSHQTVFVLKDHQGFVTGEKLLSRKDNARVIQSGFVTNKIREICYEFNGEKRYDLYIRLCVSFSYLIDNIGYVIDDIDSMYDNSSWQPFSFTIEMHVTQLPYPNWLGIDFGTSAIVSQYSGQEVHNLHNIKDKISEELGDEEPDVYEKDTPFLSSNILFRFNARLQNGEVPSSQLLSERSDVPNYHSLAVYLSPTTAQTGANGKYMLPCLKLLMGYETLPNISNYADFQYYQYSEDDTAVKVPLMIEEEGSEPYYTQLAYVNKVFEEVYRELFTYYIRKCIPKGSVKKVNKIVLTIPNTYTPMHLDALRGIIRKALPDLRIRNIKFASESDAVACFYQNNWSEINNLLKLPRTNMKLLKSEERVLIYDMGAGTLDTTLFEKHRVDGKLIISIVGKIGICKAGNYLDTVIAKQLAHKYPDLDRFIAPQDADDFQVALRLKEFIKSKVKPALNDVGGDNDKKNSLTLSNKEAQYIGFSRRTIDQNGGHITMNLKELIINSSAFEQFIDEVTRGFIDNFFRFLGYQEKQHIDTFIISGRSAKLTFIKRRIESAMKKWTDVDNMRFIDMSLFDQTQDIKSNISEVDIEKSGILSSTDNKPYADRSKTVVVEGALSYASLYSDNDSTVQFRSPNIMANYGIIYRDENGEMHYQELLNPRKDKPQKEIIKEGMTLHTYQTEPKVLNLASTNRFILVQTYSCDTINDWKKGNLEYITEMAQYWAEGRGDRAHMELSILVDETGSLTLRVNGATASGIAPSRVDINSYSNQMSLWPIQKTIKQ